MFTYNDEPEILEYNEAKYKFETDYDKENPVWKKKSLKRWLKMHKNYDTAMRKNALLKEYMEKNPRADPNKLIRAQSTLVGNRTSLIESSIGLDESPTEFKQRLDRFFQIDPLEEKN